MPNAAATQLAGLGPVHGYRFDGEQVHLKAMLTLFNSAAHDRSWALQLWACPAAPATAREIVGQLVSSLTVLQPPTGGVAVSFEFELG